MRVALARLAVTGGIMTLALVLAGPSAGKDQTRANLAVDEPVSKPGKASGRTADVHAHRADGACPIEIGARRCGANSQDTSEASVVAWSERLPGHSACARGGLGSYGWQFLRRCWPRPGRLVSTPSC